MEDLKDFMRNIEKTRNTKQQVQYYEEMHKFLNESQFSPMHMTKQFPVYASRQAITSFVEKYEIYKLCKNAAGSIVECGVAGGFGLMTFAHLASIFEPYHYVRKVIGFDTFEGFQGISEKDMTSKAEHLKPGGLKFETYEELEKVIRLYDMNRTLGHINRVELVKGNICETLPRYLKDNPSLVIALLYLDVDLYLPTLSALNLLVKRIPKGGVIAFDELNNSDYPGETQAVMEAVGIHNLQIRRLDISSMLSYAIVE